MSASCVVKDVEYETTIGGINRTSQRLLGQCNGTAKHTSHFEQTVVRVSEEMHNVRKITPEPSPSSLADYSSQHGSLLTWLELPEVSVPCGYTHCDKDDLEDDG